MPKLKEKICTEKQVLQIRNRVAKHVYNKKTTRLKIARDVGMKNSTFCGKINGFISMRKTEADIINEYLRSNK